MRHIAEMVIVGAVIAVFMFGIFLFAGSDITGMVAVDMGNEVINSFDITQFGALSYVLLIITINIAIVMAIHRATKK